MALRLSFYLLISLQLATAQLFAQSGSVAVFPFTVAGKVSASEAADVEKYVRAAVASFGLSVKSLDEMRLKIRPVAPITEFCEERDASCFAKLADQLEVRNLVVGYVERADTRLAIDVRLYEREVGKDPNGAITKQDLQYYEPGKITLQQVCHRAIGKILSRGGYLTVSTNVEGAEIIVNGNRVGTYPLKEPITLAKGRYKVALHKSGYIDYNGEIEIKIEETTSLKGALKPLPFTLTIDSNPGNASVFINDINVGYTPLNNYQILNFGKLPLKISLNQYFEYTKQIDFVPGGSYKDAVTLKPQFGDLIIATEALDAKVLIDGKFVGNTPLQVLERLPMGDHTIELSNNNYYPFKQTIKVVPGERTRYELAPKARYGKLSITTNAERARILLNDKFIGYAPYDDFVVLPPGKYKIKMSRPNFFDYDGTVTLTSGRITNLVANLKSQLAPLTISSNVTGAKVYLDDRFIGETPLKELPNIAMGEHQLLLTKPNYYDYAKKIIIRPDRANTHFAEMITIYGKLQVECDVAGVQIFLGDKFLGTTPAGVFEGLPPGEQTLRLTREGFQPYMMPVTIVSSDTVVKTINLKAVTAYVTVASNPKTAKVYVDGRDKGSTPISLPLKPGTYRIEVKSPGYNDYETKVNLTMAKPVKVDAVLSPKPFSLEVNANEREANVELDGVFIGRTPIDGYRGSSFGNHNLRVSKSGFTTVTQPVKLSPGTRTRIKIKLVPKR